MYFVNYGQKFEGLAPLNVSLNVRPCKVYKSFKLDPSSMPPESRDHFHQDKHGEVVQQHQ